MFSFSFVLSNSYANLGALLAAAGASSVVDPVAMQAGLFRNTSGSLKIYVASGYDSAPSANIGTLNAGAVLLFDEGFNANLCWVKSASGTPTLDFVIGSQGLGNGRAGSGTVTVSDTPINGQAAEFTSTTVIQGVDVTGTGDYVKDTSPTLVTPILGVAEADSLAASGSITSSSPTAGIGYTAGAGGAVTQITSRTTSVTLNKISGAITLVSAAGSTTPRSFTVTNSTVAVTDVVCACQKSGTDTMEVSVTGVAAGSFVITSKTYTGTTTEQPVINFVVLKGVSS